MKLIPTINKKFYFLLYFLITVLASDGVTAQSLALEPEPARAAGLWRPGRGTPRAAAADDGVGLVLPCPLRQGMDRVFWDRDIRFDLSNYPTIELDISCPQPAAVRRLGFYFKSGDGWYVWLMPLKDAGRQRITLAMRDAGTEGRPAGLHRIDGIRISVVPASPLNTTLTLHGIYARRPPIAIVRGTISTPNQSERNAANSVARRIGRWLDDTGISYALIDDEDVAAGRLAGARVAILPYNPYPTAPQMAALSRFVKSGGRLMVFYGASPELAQLMGLRMGEYRRAPIPGQWSSFAFNSRAPSHIPPVVTQDSVNIRPVHPDTRAAHVIAYWRDAAGRTGRDPAWVQSPAGMWMSHILLTGDDHNKKMMLLALLGHYDEGAWRDAAGHALANAGRVGPYINVDQALAGIRRRATLHNRAGAVRRYVRQADRHYKSLRGDMARNNWPQAMQQSRLLRQSMLQAYAAAQPPRQNEFRGVWDHAGLGLYPGDWHRTCRLLRESGMTAILPNLLWAGVAHYKSEVLPSSDIYKRHGDQLRQSAAAARAAGMEIHLWKVCWNLGPVPAEYINRLERAGRLQRTDDGQTLHWLCPSHPENQLQEIRAVREAAATGLIDGIHLDYVRYPGPNACFCEGCRHRFTQWIGSPAGGSPARGSPARGSPAGGSPAGGWPASARSGRLAEQFQEWRRLQITGFVQRIRDEINRINPRLKLSAAVYQGYPGCRVSVAQDWGAWLRAGLLDFVVPMNYTEDTVEFAEILRGQNNLPGAAGRVFPGLGVTASESRLTPDKVVDQIMQTRALHCGGFVLFDLNAVLATETLPILRLGPTSPD